MRTMCNQMLGMEELKRELETIHDNTIWGISIAGKVERAIPKECSEIVRDMMIEAVDSWHQMMDEKIKTL